MNPAALPADGLAPETVILPRDPAPPEPRTLLDAVLDATEAAAPRAILEEFLFESNPARALAIWLSQTTRVPAQLSREQICRRLSRDIARLDGLLSRQVNAILHHPAFQQFEASWRGLDYLVRQVPEGGGI